MGGAALAGAVVGGAGGAAIGATIAANQRDGFASDPDHFAALTPRSAPGFDHMVVVMGENRSFDNMLGYLYSQDDLPEGETFEGLAFGKHSNTSAEGETIDAHVYIGETDTIMSHPNPDPGEAYPTSTRRSSAPWSRRPTPTCSKIR